MAGAENYAEWSAAAEAFDRAHRWDRWKEDDESPHYDHQVIAERLERLRKLRANSDSSGLLFALNEGIHGNMGRMGNSALYRYARFGTKHLVREYVDEVASALNYLASGRVRKISAADKVEFFRRASHCFGRTALLLSGAGTLLYFHVGVVKALWEQALLPRVISGSSGGAFVAALLGTHSNEELKGIFDPEFLNVEIEREESLVRFLSVLNQKQVPIEEVYDILARMIPDMTFQEAQEHTGLHINIPVAPAELLQGSRLLNATTSPNVLIREAVLASCAVPGFLSAGDVGCERSPGPKEAVPAVTPVD